MKKTGMKNECSYKIIFALFTLTVYIKYTYTVFMPDFSVHREDGSSSLDSLFIVLYFSVTLYICLFS